MGDMLTELVELMSELPPVWVYISIFAIAYLENVIPPIPGDMIVVFGGYMAGLGMLSSGIVVLLASLGGALGFMSMYAIGHRIGIGLLDENRYRWLPKRRVERVREHLRVRGFGLVAANRFLSGLRSVISITVGMAHMPVGKTILWSSLSSLVWCGLLTAAGVLVGENWAVVSEYLRAYGTVIVILMVLFAGFQWFRYTKNRKSGAKE